MSKLKIILLIFLVAVVIIIGVSITLSFALAKPINMADPQIVLTAELGEVWAGKGDNLSLVSGEVVLQTGDSVKTGDKSRAKITFFDTQQATIDENSFVTIDEGFIDQNSALLTKVKLKLKNGQIWSRLLELLHPDASFEVEAQNVVATVRGTVFNVSSIDNNLKIVVFENSVSVASISDLSRAVTLQKNDVLTYQPKSATQKESKLEVSKISEREQNQDWVKSNLGQDIKFKEEVKAKREAIKKQIGVLPGENGYQTKILAEKLSLLTAKDKVKAGESIALKRLLEQQVLFEAGKVKMNKGLKLSGDLLNKMQRFNALNPDWKQAIRQDQDSSYQNLLDAEQLDFIKNKNSVGYSSFLMNLPNSDEILRNLEMMEKNMALIKQYLSAEDFAKLQTALNQLRANLPRLKYWLDQAYLNGGSVVKPAESGAIDKQEATPIKDKNSEPVNDSGTDNSPSDQPVSSDNSADDSSGSNTAENTPTDQSGDNGSAATNTDSNAGASTNPTLNNTRVLPYVVGLEAISSRYNLEPGNSATLTANAVYNNGNKVDVTKEVSWSLSPDDVTGEYVGALRGNIFIANQNMGKAYITAVYQAPDAKRYTDDLELTVFVLKPITNAR